VLRRTRPTPPWSGRASRTWPARPPAASRGASAAAWRLDEPFAGVDPVAVAALQALIRELAASGIGLLITDHAVRETLGICDRAVILDGGVVIAEGRPEQVAADAHVRARFLGAHFRLDPQG